MEMTEATGNTTQIIEPIYQAKFWMKLIGIMMILSGVVTALSIVGLIVAWIPIWAGVVLMQAAGAAERAYAQNNAAEAMNATGRLKTYFTIFGVLILVYLVFVGLALLFGIGAGLTGLLGT